ncbi:MAG: hypothetical protein ACREUQ_08870 [Burkholderiales bacterium]
MKSQSLASAFQSAISRTSSKRNAAAAPTRGQLLLSALQGSVTVFDQIVQRRIGLEREAVPQR